MQDYIRHDMHFTVFTYFRSEKRWCAVLTSVNYEADRTDTCLGEIPEGADPTKFTLDYMYNNDHVSCSEDMDRYRRAIRLAPTVDVTPEQYAKILLTWMDPKTLLENKS